MGPGGEVVSDPKVIRVNYLKVLMKLVMVVMVVLVMVMVVLMVMVER